MLGIRSTVNDADSMRLQIAYNMEVPRTILLELKRRMPFILSAVTLFAEKYQVTRLVEESKMAAVTCISEVYNTLVNYELQMSQLSIFFRNTVIQYQKAVQAFIDAVTKLLRETKFKLPGSDKLTTVPEVFREVTSGIAVVLEKIIQNIYGNIQFCYNAFVEMIINVNLRIPVGDAVASNQFLVVVKKDIAIVFEKLVDFVKKMDSLDIILEKLGETLKHVVEKTQEFVDLIEWEYLDVALVNINIQYHHFIIILKDAVGQVAVLNMEDVTIACEYIIDVLVYVTEQFNNVVYGFLQQTSEEVQAYMTISDGKLLMDVPFSFLQ